MLAPRVPHASPLSLLVVCSLLMLLLGYSIPPTSVCNLVYMSTLFVLVCWFDSLGVTILVGDDSADDAEHDELSEERVRH